MQRAKRTWKQLPNKPRRILTFIIGALLILTSALIGWIPGPGGMIPFLLGIAVLATEFTWAERFRDWVLNSLKRTGKFVKRRPVISTLFFVCVFSVLALGAYVFYTQII